MPSAVRLARVSADPLDLDAHLAAVDDDAAGAVTTFVGRVRDHDPDAGGAVVALEYTAHPDAESGLARLAAVASPHRAEAFDVCRTVIETIKTELPVWKRQVEADGTTAWKGLGG